MLNAWFTAAVMWAVCGHLGGALTAPWLGGIGGLAGWAACGLAPLGWLEILLALRARERGSAPAARALARLQIGALVLGGVLSAAVGWWALRRLGPRSSP